MNVRMISIGAILGEPPSHSKRRRGRRSDWQKFAEIPATKKFASANLTRRNLTKGQSAMLTAMMYPEGGRSNSIAAKLPKIGSFGRERLRQARSVLAHSREMAEAVVRAHGRVDFFVSEEFTRAVLAKTETRPRSPRRTKRLPNLNETRVYAPDGHLEAVSQKTVLS
jgi:hypothetical protein